MSDTVEVFGSLVDRVMDAQSVAFALRIDAVHRVVGLGVDISRVSMREKPGVLGRDVEVHVDGTPVWRAEWVQTAEYVFEQRVRWLVDVERFVHEAKA